MSFGERRSFASSASAVYFDTTRAPREYFDPTPTGPELTAALTEHWKTTFAYEFKRDLAALSPYQGIIDVISTIRFPDE